MEDKNLSNIFSSVFNYDYVDIFKDDYNPDVLDKFNEMLSELVVERKMYKQNIVWSKEEKLRKERKEKLDSIFDNNELV